MGKVEVGSKWVEVGAILSICGEESMGGGSETQRRRVRVG
jgi:hypothetical protein